MVEMCIRDRVCRHVWCHRHFVSWPLLSVSLTALWSLSTLSLIHILSEDFSSTFRSLPAQIRDYEVCRLRKWFFKMCIRDRVGKKGVVRDPAVHEEVIEKVRDFAMSISLEPCHLSFSPIKGPEGNIEYLLHLKKRPCLLYTSRCV